MINKIINIIFTLPLIIYPFVLLANVMSFAAENRATQPAALRYTSLGFLIVSTLYPVSVVISWLFIKQNKLSITLIPIIHLILCFVCYYLWDYAEKSLK